MNKFDNSVISNLEMLCLDMINEGGGDNAHLILNTAPLFYHILMHHLNFDVHNANWSNRDRLLVSNAFLPLFYSGMHLFTRKISLDNLKDYKKLGSLCSGCANMNTPLVEIGSLNNEDVIATSLGIALGERYLDNLIKIEIPKCELINFHTYCLCEEDDLNSGSSFEALSYAGKENLNKLIYLVVRDNASKEKKNLNFYEDLGFNVEEINLNNMGDVKGAIEDAKVSKKPTILFFKVNNREEIIKKNAPLTLEVLNKFKEINGFENAFDIKETLYLEINKQLEKRMEKVLAKWQKIKEDNLGDLKVKNILNFLENKTFNIKFIPENIKINDNYEEELNISNTKIFNLFTSKSPYILNISDEMVSKALTISKSGYMHKDSPTDRNISINKQYLSLAYTACGLASLGFKVIYTTSLVNASKILPAIKLSTYSNLDVNYLFTEDSFISSENMENAPVSELNTLRGIPNLVTIRPADINEIIGAYAIMASMKKPLALVIGKAISKKWLGTNPKYVMAGAYRIKKEIKQLDAIIVASGSEVKTALKVAEDLQAYGLDLRVVTMPSQELFNIQTEKYRNILLPKEIKTFTIEYEAGCSWYHFASGDNYIFGINEYPKAGTKEEILNYYKLNIDAIKTQIIEILKNK